MTYKDVAQDELLCLGVPPCFCVYPADGKLMFQQVPLVEIDGMKLVQTKAILNYLAEKYNMHGKDLKDRVMYGLLFVYLFIRHNKDSLSCN